MSVRKDRRRDTMVVQAYIDARDLAELSQYKPFASATTKTGLATRIIEFMAQALVHQGVIKRVNTFTDALSILEARGLHTTGKGSSYNNALLGAIEQESIESNTALLKHIQEDTE